MDSQTAVVFLKGGIIFLSRKPQLMQDAQDQILATCEENKLEYVLDTTNFQPEIGIRNAIRHVLRQDAGVRKQSLQSAMKDIPKPLLQRLEHIQHVAAQRELSFDLTSNLEDLREANSTMCAKVEETNQAGLCV